MATAAEEEVEYESDPEESKRSLAMRRREAASDDEEGDAKDDRPRMDRRAGVNSDESDGQGGAAEYDYEDELGVEDEEEEYSEEEEEEIVEEPVEEEGEGDVQRNGERVVKGSMMATVLNETVVDGKRNVEDVPESHEGSHVGEEEEEEEKKENEPFAVPTAGAFYMHDDRFRDNARGRNRRTHLGRKLWESKDDRKWGHDKFEEMTLREKHYDEGKRSSRGRHRAYSRNQGADRGYSRGSRSKSLNKNNNQSQASKVVRGRGPRRYELAWKMGSQALPTQSKRSGKALEKTFQPNPTRTFPPSTNVESASVPARKHVASSLNSASPPFFPSGSLNKDITLTQKKDMQAVTVSRNQENFPTSQTNALRGKNIVDSVGIEKLHIDDSNTSTTGKTSTNLQMLPSGSSFSSSQVSRTRTQGSGLAIPGQMAYVPASTQNKVNRVSPSTQLHAVQRSSSRSRGQSSVQASPQQVGQTSSPSKTGMSVNSNEPGEEKPSSESSNFKGALVGKGKGTIQGAGRGSFLYGGAQVMGATGSMAVSHGDQSFPAFLPVMQFGGQHPGGIGVPAVGMAFPGYVTQPQLGLGNSEMTWLPVPVLTGAAGSLGPTYCSPYISVDGAYNTHTSVLTSSMSSSSKENNPNKSNNGWDPSQKPELASDEFGRQNNPNKQPRRYSEMSFSK
ncbi:hypothetical protein SLEP1_g21548 [Rubroshorea leprosula]|uniref:Btz domain-containing protein n=1 Tax=Rubroshorea leprosula TaxID=152421 RepID=A0AAV5JFG3_9ROSI|nr:hypothetical protein SLEP1_g21548 [Rubroshorea leprosula]